jgi:uncharacterized protein YqhQ
MKNLHPVGGQAVIEGVMMRSPHCLAVVVRAPDGALIVRQRKWISLADKWRFWRWPFFRGILTLGESLHNGISALNFSASVQENPGQAEEKAGSLWLTMTMAVIMALALFAALPHFLTWGIGWLAGSENLSGGTSLWFHLVDGIIKLVIFVSYIWAISLIPEIKRVFQYHGAEHKGIYTYEKRQELTVANAATHTTLHPRCGTAFLLVVLFTAILVFTTIFPFVPPPSSIAVVNHLIFVFIKLVLLFPIAGLSYEVIKLAGKNPNHPFLRIAIFPGLVMQRLTTQEPDESQLEVSIASLLTVLAAEADHVAHPDAEIVTRQDRYESFDEFIQRPQEAA